MKQTTQGGGVYVQLRERSTEKPTLSSFTTPLNHIEVENAILKYAQEKEERQKKALEN